MQSIEQHYYRETKEKNSNCCKLLVKKDAMLDSLNARERSHDNSANGSSESYVCFHCSYMHILFDKYMIQNPIFVYVILLHIVYAIVLRQAAQAHASRKSQRLIHERVTRCVTRC